MIDFGELFIKNDPVQTLRNFSMSSLIGQRELYPRVLECILQTESSELILSNKDEILDTLNVVANDAEIEVRSNLVGNGNMISICTCLTQLDQNFVQTFGVFLLDHILMIVLKYLSDEATVRKNANSTLLYLIENGFLDKKVIYQKVCPIILSLLNIEKIESSANSEFNIQINSIGIMAKVAPIIGTEMTNEIFFEKFIELTQNEVPNIRKQCVTVYPVMCEVLGNEVLESHMLPLYVKLCDDTSWNIRNTCAQNIQYISILCSLNLRRKYLVPIMKKFMFDDSRWVIISALNSLGEFLATFAQPPIIGLAYNYRLELFITNAADQEFRQQCQSNMILYSNQPNSSVIFKNLEHYESEFAKEFVIEQSLSHQHGDGSKTSRSLSVPNNNAASSSSTSAAKLKLSPSTADATSTPVTSTAATETKKMNIETYLLSIIKASHFSDRMNTSGGRLSSTTASESDECELFSIQSSLGNSTAAAALLKRLSSSSTGDDLSAINNLNNNNNKNKNYNNDSSSDDNNNGNDSFDNFLKFNTPLKNNFVNNRHLTPDTVETSFVWHMGFGGNSDDGVHHNYDYILKENGSNEEDDDDDDDITDFDNNYNSKSSLVVKSYVDDAINNGDAVLMIDSNDDTFEKKLDNLTLGDKENNNTTSEEDSDLEQFNSHQYWYIAPPNLIDIAELNNNSIDNQSTIVMDEDETESVDSMKISNTGNISDKMELLNETPPDAQLAVENNPEEIEWTLIEDFVYMKDIDNNLCFKCAYNFPAVLLTLGRKFWPLLHQHFLSLCNDLQSNVRVRKTMAKSIYQIALIIGSEQATKDLVAPFVEFFKDTDEIKIEVLKQVSNFIKIVDPSKHELIINQLEMCWLPKINVINWRLREQIGIQIVELNKVVLRIQKDNCVLYLTGLALKLMMDKYDSVRKVGIDAFVSCVERSKQKKQLLKFLSFHFASSSRWREKQIYILTVDKLLERKAIEPKLFNLYVLKKLLEMSNDKIPNIRICLARCLSTLAENSFYLSEFGESKKRIMQEIANFEKDSDRDVRDSVISSDLSFSSNETLPPLPLPPPFQLEIVEPYDPPPPFEEHETVTTQQDQHELTSEEEVSEA